MKSRSKFLYQLTYSLTDTLIAIAKKTSETFAGKELQPSAWFLVHLLLECHKLEQHIYEGGTIADFVHSNEGAIENRQELSEELTETSEPIADIQSSNWLNTLPVLVNSLADAIAQRITPPVNPLAELEALEKAYEKKWILSTSQLASLLKLNPKTLIRYKSFERHGFTFTRSGVVGGEIGWRVDKVDL